MSAYLWAMRMIAVVVLVGCATVNAPTGDDQGPPGEEPGAPSLPGPSQGPALQIPTNGLVLDSKLLVTLTPAPLGLAHGQGSFDVNPAAAPGFVEVESGRALLKYIAICALRPDQELTIGDTHLPGFYGLAPQWATDACDVSCQHWVIGCVLAHANNKGDPVQISLRGDHPGLAATPEREAAFDQQEAGFYGTFGTNELGAPQLYACMGATATTDAYQRFLVGRACGAGSCGLRSAGKCVSLQTAFTPPTVDPWLSACGDDRGAEGFGDCRPSLSFRAVPYHEVVTVYTRR